MEVPGLADFDGSEKFHMAVVTPAHPTMNSTHSVTASNIKILSEEFELGSKISYHVLHAQEALWGDLFEEVDFFQQFRHFIEINTLAKSFDEFLKWHGKVESKLRSFMEQLEGLEQKPIIRIYPKEFTIKEQTFKYAKAFFIGLKLIKRRDSTETAPIDLRLPVK